MSLKSVFKMPKPVKITGRSSSITNSFVNGIIPIIEPSESEIQEALSILEMDENNICCAYCGDPYTEWDHLRPLVIDKTATGYISEIHNLVPSCGKCNQSKGNQNWKDWMFSNATLSPKTKNVSDINIRGERLSKYENWGSPIRVDFEVLIGKYKWQQHWKNCEEIHNLMRQSQILSDEIKTTILNALNSNNEEISKCFYNSVHLEIPMEHPILIQNNSITTTSSNSDYEYKSSEIANHSIELNDYKKIGKLVQEDFVTLLRSEKINDDVLMLLQSSSYSKQFFDVNYPILLAVNSEHEEKTKGIDSTGRNRYYAKSLKIHGKNYLLTAQWFDRSKNKLLCWMQKYL